MDWLPGAARLFRALLWAYPAPFRHEYGAEMEDLFVERLRTEPPVRVWRQALVDLALTAPREHFHILAGDLHYAARLFAQAPAFTLVVLLTIGLGIGGSSAVFSLVNAVLLRSLPFGDAARLVFLWTPNRHFGPPVPLELGPANPDFYAWQRESRSFSRLALIIQGRLRVTGGNGLERIGGARVTGAFFATLDAEPELGRAIAPEDDQPGRESVAVISHALWQARFGGDAAVLGQTLTVDGKPRRIVGVMPPGFEFPRRNELPADISNVERTDIWIPAAFTPQEKQSNSMDSIVVGRLGAGVSITQAQAEMRSLEKRLDDARPPGDRGWWALVRPLRETVVGPVRPQMGLLLGAVSLVLLIACGNVAGLLLARAAGRVHEMSVRGALGADRARLVRQAISEAMLLASVGGALGVGAAQAAVRLLVRLNPGDIPRLEQASLDGRVLLFAVAVSLVTGLACGVAPALAASHHDLMSLLRQGGNTGMAGGRGRVRGSLIVAEVALSMVLVAGAGLLIQSDLKLQSEGAGFAPSTLSMRISAPAGDDAPGARRPEAFERLASAVRALPGVKAAGWTNALPFSHYESVGLFEIEGYDNRKDQLADDWDVAPGYFQAMQIPLREGRFFDARDMQDNPRVAIANQAFAERYLAGGAALGRRVRLGGLDSKGPWNTVIGVVGSVRHSRIDEAPRAALYIPAWPRGSGFLAVRGDALARLALAIQAIVHRQRGAWEIGDIRTMREALSEAGSRRKFQTLLLTAFAGMALFLALVGLYGAIAYSVKQRSGEIGIRMALGASRAQVVAMVLRQGAGLTAAGLALGLAGAMALTRLIAGWLYRVSPVDAPTLAAVAALLFLVSVAACALPAWKAARIDPVAALRD